MAEFEKTDFKTADKVSADVDRLHPQPVQRQQRCFEELAAVQGVRCTVTVEEKTNEALDVKLKSCLGLVIHHPSGFSVSRAGGVVLCCVVWKTTFGCSRC